MSRDAKKPNSKVLFKSILALSVSAALVGAVLFGTSLVSGCLSLKPLREGRYSELTIPHLEAAGDSSDEEVFAGVVGLLELRLDDHTAVELDYALEALVALMKIGRKDAVTVVSRCAREDTDEELRYMALETLVSLDPEKSRTALSKAAGEDTSDLVRDHALELLAQIDRT